MLGVTGSGGTHHQIYEDLETDPVKLEHLGECTGNVENLKVKKKKFSRPAGAAKYRVHWSDPNFRTSGMLPVVSSSIWRKRAGR